MEETKKLYEEAFKNKYEYAKVISKEQHKGLGDFINIIQQRLECELQYSKSMQKVGTIPLTLNAGTLLQGIQSFQANCLNRSEQAASYIENTKAEVLEPLKLLLKEQEGIMKSYSTQVRQLDKDMIAVHTRLKKIKDRVLQELKETEDVLYRCEDYRKNPREAIKMDPQIQDKLNVKMGAQLRTYRESLEAYKSYWKYTKDYEEQYMSSMLNIVSNSQKMEEQKIETLKDSLKKMLLYEVAMEQNNKYDIEHLSTVIEEINSKKDIQSLIGNQLSRSPVADPVVLITSMDIPKSPWAKLFDVYEQNYIGKEDFLDYAAVVEETKAYILKTDDKEFQETVTLLKQFTEKLLTKEITLDKGLKDKVKEVLNTKKGRIGFLETLNGLIASGKTKLSQEGYKELALDMLQFLDKAYIEMEADAIYQIIGVANRLYVADEDNKENLLFTLKTHDVWKDLAFWSKAIKIILDIEVRIQRNIILREAQKSSQTVTSAEKDQREKGAIFGRINGLIKEIQEFGVEIEDIRQLILQVCMQFKLSIKQIDTLNATIDSYSKGKKAEKLPEETKSATTETVIPKPNC